MIAFTFLLPDVMRGFAFLRKGYFLIGLVHAFIGLFGMLTTSLYAAVTASNDIALLTNVSVGWFWIGLAGGGVAFLFMGEGSREC